MKHAEQYLMEELKIQPLGKVTFEPSSSGEEVGYSVIIDGKDIGLEIWWSDYATWLEKKINEMSVPACAG